MIFGFIFYLIFFYYRLCRFRVRDRQFAIRFRLRNWWVFIFTFRKKFWLIKKKPKFEKNKQQQKPQQSRKQEQQKKWSTLAIVQWSAVLCCDFGNSVYAFQASEFRISVSHRAMHTRMWIVHSHKHESKNAQDTHIVFQWKFIYCRLY